MGAAALSRFREAVRLSGFDGDDVKAVHGSSVQVDRGLPAVPHAFLDCRPLHSPWPCESLCWKARDTGMKRNLHNGSPVFVMVIVMVGCTCLFVSVWPRFVHLVHICFCCRYNLLSFQWFQCFVCQLQMGTSGRDFFFCRNKTQRNVSSSPQFPHVVFLFCLILFCMLLYFLSVKVLCWLSSLLWVWPPKNV